MSTRIPKIRRTFYQTMALVVIIAIISVVSGPSRKVSWQDVTLERFSPGVTLQELKAEYGAPLLYPEIQEGWLAWSRKVGKDEVVIKYQKRGNIVRLTGNRLVYRGRVIARGWEHFPYSPPVSSSSDTPSRQSDIQTLLGAGDEQFGKICYFGELDSKLRCRLAVNLATLPQNEKNRQVFNFEFSWTE